MEKFDGSLNEAAADLGSRPTNTSLQGHTAANHARHHRFFVGLYPQLTRIRNSRPVLAVGNVQMIRPRVILTNFEQQ
jgi:hypothetical protein